MRWSEVIDSPYLQNLPFKIELNRFGKILMSPASNRHGMMQVAVVTEIGRRRRDGQLINECSVQTADGVKVADVAWASDSFIAKHGYTTPYKLAPEICVEVVSPSNSKVEMRLKAALYLARGAEEVWVVDENGAMRVFDHEGERGKSRLVKNFKLKLG